MSVLWGVGVVTVIKRVFANRLVKQGHSVDLFYETLNRTGFKSVYRRKGYPGIGTGWSPSVNLHRSREELPGRTLSRLESLFVREFTD